MKRFVCVIFLLAAVFGAEALQCVIISEYDCTAFDSSLRSACNELEAGNTRYNETCLPASDSCYYSTFYVTDPGRYRLTVRIGGCENGVMNGCYSRSQLAIIDPDIGDSIDDTEDIFGSDIQGFQACFCTSNLCNTGLPNQGGVTPKQGGVTTKQGGVTTKQGGVTTKQGGVTPKQGGVTPKQGGVTPKQGGVTPNQEGVTPPWSNSSLLVQTSYMIVGLLAFTALLPMIDFAVM